MDIMKSFILNECFSPIFIDLLKACCCYLLHERGDSAKGVPQDDPQVGDDLSSLGQLGEGGAPGHGVGELLHPQAHLVPLDDLLGHGYGASKGGILYANWKYFEKEVTWQPFDARSILFLFGKRCSDTRMF
jgi:hypothetical protein